MTTRARAVLLVVFGVLGCGDDDGGASDAGGQDSGDHDAGGGGDPCPNLAGTWTIDQHCETSFVGDSVPVTQRGCVITTEGRFDGFAGTVAADGSLQLQGGANGVTIACTGTATTTLITQTCTGDCEVTLTK